MNKQQALERVVEVMNDGHDGRITQATMDHYRNAANEGTSEKHLFKIAKVDGEPVGASVVMVKDNQATHSITVVKRSHRRQGIASKLVKAMLEECEKHEVKFSAGIAEDNTAAKGLMDKFDSEAPLAGSERATRRSGEFTRLWYGAMPIKAAAIAGRVQIEDGEDEDEVLIESVDD